jgi:hypothetical protein
LGWWRYAGNAPAVAINSRDLVERILWIPEFCLPGAPGVHTRVPEGNLVENSQVSIKSTTGLAKYPFHTWVRFVSRDVCRIHDDEPVESLYHKPMSSTKGDEGNLPVHDIKP